uniref:Uncharacterized protein n=1 Tax=Prevotella sp. GTC17262 TaxID=3236797 RepID=A0AB33JD07_9BACT
MYSVKEKLYHFRQLTNPLAVEADLALLHEKNPQSTDFTRFDLAPQKNAEDILFALLDVADHDDIVRNRREFFSKQEVDDELPIDKANSTVDAQGSDVLNSTPVENSVENSTENKGNKASKKSPIPKKKKKSTLK